MKLKYVEESLKILLSILLILFIFKVISERTSFSGGTDDSEDKAAAEAAAKNEAAEATARELNEAAEATARELNEAAAAKNEAEEARARELNEAALLKI